MSICIADAEERVTEVAVGQLPTIAEDGKIERWKLLRVKLKDAPAERANVANPPRSRQART